MSRQIFLCRGEPLQWLRRVDPLRRLGRTRSLRGRADRRAHVVALGFGVQLALTDAELWKSPLEPSVFEALNGWERAALDAGCDAYVSKPISASHFLAMIDSFLSKGDHRDDGITGRAAVADKRYEGRIREDRPEPIG